MRQQLYLTSLWKWQASYSRRAFQTCKFRSLTHCLFCNLKYPIILGIGRVGILEEDDLKVEGGEVAGVEETVTRTEGKTTVLETGGAQDEEDMELLDHGLIEAVHGGVMMVEDGQNDEASEASLVIVDLGQRAHPVVVENSLLDLEVEEGVHLVGREEIVHLAVGRNRTSSLSIDLF
mmetsp:Transcript_17215/g.23782  ORF Transcript_17215/g.23782 Transcript_17215/m.23782 type:complete len:177 (-) Transcript_17215:436-966(-)